MSAKKFERLIDLIINEDQERAEQLFHEIVVEKSRQIYESMMDQTGEETGDMMSEIESEEHGMMEDDEEFDMGDESEEGMDDEEFDMDDGLDMGDDEGGEGFEDEDEEGLEDRVVDLEDKLDQLMADFEAEMGGADDSEEDMGDDEEFDMDDEEDMGDEDMGDEDMGDEEDEVMESVELKKVSVTHGDNGAQTKSPGLANPKRIQTGAAPVKFAGDSESVPTSAKKPSNVYSKGEKEEDFGNINKVGGTAGKTAFKTKAPAPKTETVSAKSPVAEGKRTAKRRI